MKKRGSMWASRPCAGIGAMMMVIIVSLLVWPQYVDKDTEAKMRVIVEANMQDT